MYNSPENVDPGGSCCQSNSPQDSNSRLSDLSEEQARHPEYTALRARLATFQNWPPSNTQAPHDLADAGFFYANRSDRVKCYFCGGGLHSWLPEDNAWCEHARVFPGCGYILRTQGQSFIDAVHRGQAPTPRDITRAPTVNTGEDEVSSRRSSSHGINVSRLMMTEQALIMVEMGFDRDLIEQVIRQRMDTVGRMFDSPDEMLNSLMSLPETEMGIEMQESTSMGESERGASQSLLNRSSLLSQTDIREKFRKLQEEKKKLLSANEAMKKSRICRVCETNGACMLVLPCAHLVLCDECSKNSDNMNCPDCDKPIRGTIRTYWQ